MSNPGEFRRAASSIRLRPVGAAPRTSRSYGRSFPAESWRPLSPSSMPLGRGRTRRWGQGTGSRRGLLTGLSQDRAVEVTLTAQNGRTLHLTSVERGGDGRIDSFEATRGHLGQRQAHTVTSARDSCSASPDWGDAASSSHEIAPGLSSATKLPRTVVRSTSRTSAANGSASGG